MDPSQRLDGLINGFRATQVVRAAAVWGVADALAAGPLSAAEVAEQVGADPPSLHRLLRCLAALGVLTDGGEGRFANSDLGELLRTDVTGSLHSAAVARPQDSWWSAWGQLPAALADGRVPYELARGQSFWDDLDADAEAESRFNTFMAQKTTAFLSGLLRHYDFSPARRVIDVGGGTGALIGGILRAEPGPLGVLVDQAGGLRGARELLAGLGVLERCEVVVGDFFDVVPSGGDVYILRQILHDWPDSRAEDILRVCRRAMNPGAQLLVIDHALPERVTEGPEARVALESDLHMFVLFGARERTERELTAMLETSGFVLDRILPTEPERTLVATAR